MLFKNVAPEIVDACAMEVGAIAYRQSQDRRRAVLRPLPESPYRRRSNSGRRVNAVCWHLHRDFFRSLFERAPDAIVETRLAPIFDVNAPQKPTRYTAENFESSFEETGSVNVGSTFDPLPMRGACDCPEGWF